MMKKFIAASALVFAVGYGSAQTNNQPNPTVVKHYRLTFVLSYPNGRDPQSYSVEVPVAAGQPGVASITMASGSAASAQATTQQSIQCTDVHTSTTGLAASVSIALDSETLQPEVSTSEPVHHHLQFNQKFDVALGRPTRISEEMHYKKLNHGVATDASVPASEAAPEITVTATEM